MWLSFFLNIKVNGRFSPCPTPHTGTRQAPKRPSIDALSWTSGFKYTWQTFYHVNDASPCSSYSLLADHLDQMLDGAYSSNWIRQTETQTAERQHKDRHAFEFPQQTLGKPRECTHQTFQHSRKRRCCKVSGTQLARYTTSFPYVTPPTALPPSITPGRASDLIAFFQPC